jgi:hypothetical protein
VRRRIKHACTLEQWRSPAHRAEKIEEAWRLAIDTIRAEGFEFVTPAPVTLYRDLFGRVVLADISMPGEPLWIDPQGRVILAPSVQGLIPTRTTYAKWAEGPLPYTGDAPDAAPDPLRDRNLQYLRNQNSALRAVIDASLESARDAIPQDIAFRGIVDFRIRGVFSTAAPAIFDSKQTNRESAVRLDGQMVDVDDLTQ